MKKKPHAEQPGGAFSSTVWFDTDVIIKANLGLGAGIMLCMGIVMVGQWRIYPKLEKLESRIESLEVLQSQPIQPLASSQPNSTQQPDVDAPQAQAALPPTADQN
jgi:hypothetical protein